MHLETAWAADLRRRGLSGGILLKVINGRRGAGDQPVQLDYISNLALIQCQRILNPERTFLKHVMGCDEGLYN